VTGAPRTRCSLSSAQMELLSTQIGTQKKCVKQQKHLCSSMKLTEIAD
jgi:hypothetical protein